MCGKFIGIGTIFIDRKPAFLGPCDVAAFVLSFYSLVTCPVAYYCEVPFSTLCYLFDWFCEAAKRECVTLCMKIVCIQEILDIGMRTFRHS